MDVEELVIRRLSEERVLYSNTIPQLWDLNDLDEQADREFHEAARGGGWTAWHCEGSPVRSLFTLCLWHVIFPVRQEGQEEEESMFGFPSEVIPNVFITPYQDGPLDLHFPAFYRDRKTNIDIFFDWLVCASNEMIINLIGVRYRRNYRRDCAGVAWDIDLQILQVLLSFLVCSFFVTFPCVNRC